MVRRLLHHRGTRCFRDLNNVQWSGLWMLSTETNFILVVRQYDKMLIVCETEGRHEDTTDNSRRHPEFTTNSTAAPLVCYKSLAIRAGICIWKTPQSANEPSLTLIWILKITRSSCSFALRDLLFADEKQNRTASRSLRLNCGWRETAGRSVEKIKTKQIYWSQNHPSPCNASLQ